ncbi:MAG: hypothetical protein ACXAC5_00655 [Promethearchaeota archaeon]
MLSFLHTASEVVERMSAGLSLGHPWITSPRKADHYFKVYLTRRSIKNAVSVSPKEAREGCHHFKKSNHVSAPLFVLSEAVRREDRETFLRKQVFAPMEVLYDLATQHPATKELWSRLKRYRNDPLGFLKEITNAVLATDDITEEDLESKSVVVFLENYQSVTADGSLLFFSMTSRNELIRILRDQDQSSVEGLFCDVFGDVGEAVTTPLPKVKAGGLVQFSPYERNEDTAAYARYGLNSVAACPITKATRERIYDALMALTSPQFRNKIWSHARDPIGRKEYVDRQTIVVPDFGESDAPAMQEMIEIGPLSVLDNLLEDSDAEDTADETEVDESTELGSAEETIQTYKRLAEPVIAALEGKAKDYPEACYHLSVTQKFGKGAPVKSVHRSVPFVTLIERLRFWLDAVEAPRNRTFGYFAEGKRVVTNENEAVRPFEIPRILNRCWKQNAGTDSGGKFIKGYDAQISRNIFSASAALDLFLFHDSRVAAAMLDQIARHHIWLMHDVAHRDRHIKSALIPSHKKGSRPHCRRDVLKFLGLISILYRVQENMMSQEQVQEAVEQAKERQATVQDAMLMEVPYRMGRALAIADILHRKKFKSHSQYPALFVGESCFPSLIRGSQIREYWSRFVARVRHIEKWAQRYVFKVSEKERKNEPVDPQDAETAKYFFWFSKEMKEIAGNEIPDRFSSSDKCLFTCGFYSLR